jgi:putative nucleotidyltransferase with HDIG domain
MKSLESTSSQDANRVRPAVAPRAPWWVARNPAPQGPKPELDLTDEEHLLCLRVGQRANLGDFHIPSIPLVAAEAVAVLNHADPDPRRISKLIQRDHQLAADVVSFANSALFAGVMPVTNIPQAIARVGFHRTRNLILASSLRGLILGACEAGRAERLWRHSLGCASISSRIARNLRSAPDDAYLAGLFHDVGKAVVLSILSNAALKSKTPRRAEFVDHVVELYHEGVGVAVTTQWRLPDHVVKAIQKHTESANTALTKPQAIIALSDNVCHRLNLGVADDGRPIASEATLEALGVRPEDLSQIFEGVLDVLDP